MDNSIFDREVWKKYLPKELTIVTSNGNFNLVFSEVSIIGNLNIAQIVYYHNTNANLGDELKDGEPDYLEIDIHLVQNNDGTKASSDLKFNVDITYGDAMVSEFIIKMPGKVEVIHYTGIGSKYDKDTEFGFDDKSLQDLINFFNRFGFKLDKKDFTFIDKYPDSYTYTEAIKIMPSFNSDHMIVVNNTKPQENRFLQNILDYLKMRGVEYVVVSNKEELKKNNSENAIGCISSGSDYRLTDQNDANAEHTNIEALNSLKCPILGMCYAMQSMAKNNGANLATLDKVFDDNVKLSEYDNQHPLFNGIDLTNTQVSFNFNDYVESCPQGFKTIAKLDDKIAGIANDEKKHYGLLFHPEDIEDTYPILDNFIKICKKGTSAEDLQSVDANKNDMKYLQTYESFRQKRIK